ncbi:hypothetical protein SDC9_203009 [bioreactor metagenome]|uniref:Uncharacterized protein n=1 Tax=bioreactor metagenome TaxID=1076179 RepID=A0A645IW14_9ZZZZ
MAGGLLAALDPVADRAGYKLCACHPAQQRALAYARLPGKTRQLTAHPAAQLIQPLARGSAERDDRGA